MAPREVLQWQRKRSWPVTTFLWIKEDRALGSVKGWTIRSESDWTCIQTGIGMGLGLEGVHPSVHSLFHSTSLQLSYEKLDEEVLWRNSNQQPMQGGSHWWPQWGNAPDSPPNHSSVQIAQNSHEERERIRLRIWVLSQLYFKVFKRNHLQTFPNPYLSYIVL